MRRANPSWAVLALIVVAGCGEPSATRSATPAAEPTAQEPPPPAGDKSGRADAERPDEDEASSGGRAGFPNLSDALGLRPGAPPLPEGLIPGGDCPAERAAEAEIAAQAAALVPLKGGLTLANTWNPNANEEYECLTQITNVGPEGLDFTIGCNDPRRPEILRRRVCRADLRHARMLHTQVGGVTVIDETGEEVAETIVGATEFSLSSREFRELKQTGATPHHYVQIGTGENLEIEATGVLRLEGRQTARVIVNNAAVELPVIHASGEANMWRHGTAGQGWIGAVILDDERFPLLVDYVHAEQAHGAPVFRLHFPKVSYPDQERRDEGSAQGGAGGPALHGIGEMERRLVETRRVDVYGIYFDFASDRIRPESEPILREIAAMLGRNPEWTLGIHGHTDNIGGEGEYNLDLSRRRSEAVRRSLVERYGITPGRLATAGYGASVPKDTNETPEGRARNRRVELVRQ